MSFRTQLRSARHSKRSRSTVRDSSIVQFRRLLCEPLEDRTLLSTTAIAGLPLAEQYAISAAMGKDQSSYHVDVKSTGITLGNTANGFQAQLQSGVLEVSAGASDWQMALTKIGRGGASQLLSDPQVQASDNRVDCDYGPIDAWYVNGPLGLQQGFTIPSPQQWLGDTACEPLTVELALGGNLTATVNGDGDGLTLARADGSTALRYGGLVAYDTTGKVLPAWLEMRADAGRQDLLIHVTDTGAQGPITIDPFVQAAKLTSSDGADGDSFGFSVAISGDTMVIGADRATVASNSWQGAAYVFVKPTLGWANMTQTAKLTASDGMGYDQFGYSVAISGDTVVVGLVGAVGYGNRGAAYVFTKPTLGWTNMTQTAKLTASDGDWTDSFGQSVGISGDTVVVGAEDATVNGKSQQGAVYIFTKPGSTWSNTYETAKLTVSNGTWADRLGKSVAIDGDTVVAGSYTSHAAYVFTKPGSTWKSTNETAKLTSSDGVASFNCPVAISGDTVVVGADQATVGSNSRQGAAYVFTKSGAFWGDMTTPTGTLTAFDGAAHDNFGCSVAIRGDTVAVGTFPDLSEDEAAYVFSKPMLGWTSTTQATKLTASNASAFGLSVSISVDAIVVGAPYMGGSPSGGAAYVFANASAPDLSISKTHTGNFRQGDTGDSYTIAVSNIASTATTGMVTVTDTLPTGLTPNAANNGTINGWAVSTSGQTVTATRSDTLAGESSYPALTLTVNVAADAPATVTNTATVSGGGDVNTANNTASDPTTIISTVVYTDGFDYPLGDRGYNGTGQAVPLLEFANGSFPETNNLYPNSPTASPSRAGSTRSGWYNYQDVGNYYDGGGGIHSGEDWNLGSGDADAGEPVYAVANGIVKWITPAFPAIGPSAGGWIIVVLHTLPSGEKYYSIYEHVTDVGDVDGTIASSEAAFSVQEEQTVTRGQMIGRIAKHGTVILSSHLHFEIRDYVRALGQGQNGLYYTANAKGYYSNMAREILSPVMSATQVTQAYALMQEEGIVDPSDFIDAHRPNVSPMASLFNPTNGGSIEISVINSRAYIDVAFTDMSGSGLNTSTVTDSGQEFTLSGVAASGVSINGSPTLVSGTTYRYAFTGSFSAGTVGVTFTAGAFADNAGNTNLGASESFTVTLVEKPNLTPYQPSGWSDKIVVSNSTGTTADNVPLYTTDTLYMDWAVTNIGTVSTPVTYYTTLYLDGAFLYQWYRSVPLEPSYYTWISDFSLGRLSAGLHTLQIVADSSDSIPEGDETDNSYIKPFTVYSNDITPPTVTINQAASQADPANAAPINFTVIFSEAVSDFATGDVSLAGSTATGTLVATVTGSGTTYNVAVSGMTGSGTIIGSIAAGVAHDVAGNPNLASTSQDNVVTYRQNGPTACGVYDPGESKFYLKYINKEGFADRTFGFGVPGWKPLAGDWNGDGIDTIGLFQPAAAHFYLRNSNDSGPADVSFGYGNPSEGNQYVLVMGDWNGDGIDTIGLYHKASATWFLRNTNSEGMADVTVGFGAPGSNWTPVVGDWDADGKTTIGLYDPATGMFYLRNSLTTGMADIAFPYGVPGSGWTPLIGDWDGDGRASVGFYQPGAASHFYLRNDFSAGPADVHFGLGFGGVQPVVGHWTAAGSALFAEGGSGSAEGGSAAALAPSPESLAPLVSAALAQWSRAGVFIATPQVIVTDLPGSQLGEARDGVIYLDRDAAGHGWFIDPTPALDEEFARLGSANHLTAIDARAADKIDLLTVIEHELGHLAGLPDLDAAVDSLMSGTLPVGERRD